MNLPTIQFTGCLVWIILPGKLNHPELLVVYAPSIQCNENPQLIVLPIQLVDKVIKISHASYVLHFKTESPIDLIMTQLQIE